MLPVPRWPDPHVATVMLMAGTSHVAELPDGTVLFRFSDPVVPGDTKTAVGNAQHKLSSPGSDTSGEVTAGRPQHKKHQERTSKEDQAAGDKVGLPGRLPSASVSFPGSPMQEADSITCACAGEKPGNPSRKCCRGDSTEWFTAAGSSRPGEAPAASWPAPDRWVPSPDFCTSISFEVVCMTMLPGCCR